MRSLSTITQKTQSILDHPWDVSRHDAENIQLELRDLVEQAKVPASISRMGAIETAYLEGADTIQVGIVLFSYPGLEPQCEITASAPVKFPYYPGLLAFREGPAILSALDLLDESPDLFFIHAHGMAHPVRFGMACHLGVRLGVPCIGVARSLLVGTFKDLKPERGCCAPILDSGEVIGAAVRTQRGVRPVFVSIGHRISLPAAIDLTLACTQEYRWPDPLRAAHHLAVSQRISTIAI